MGEANLFLYLVRAIVMVTALPVHECAHALVAGKLGDDTARKNGRLTLNPFVHLDLIGSVLLILAGFGWAKPVPVDPRNFKHPKRDLALSSLAGPVSNILYAFVLYALLKLLVYSDAASRLLGFSNYYIILQIVQVMVTVNVYLAVFNFLPVPPLDGSKIIGGLLPDRLYFAMMRSERYVAMILFVLIWFGFLSRPLQLASNYILSGLDFLTRPIDILMTR